MDRLDWTFVFAALLVSVVPSENGQVAAGILVGSVLSSYAVGFIREEEEEEKRSREEEEGDKRKKSKKHLKFIVVHAIIAGLFGPVVTYWVAEEYFNRDKYPIFSVALLCSGVVGFMGLAFLKFVLPILRTRLSKAFFTFFGVDTKDMKIEKDKPKRIEREKD